MSGVRRWGITAGLVVSMLAVSGCGGSAPEQSGATSSPRPAAEASGDTLTVEPAATIDGATPYTSDGITVQVPDGWETDRTEDADVVQIMVYDPADELNPVAITVSSEASDEAVDVQADVTWTQLGGAGAIELERHPVEWPAWAYAAGLTGVIERDAGATSTFVSISARDDAESVMVSVSAQTGEGDLEGSVQHEVLRTVGPAS